MAQHDVWETSADAQLAEWRFFLNEAVRDARAAPTLAWAMFRGSFRSQRRQSLLGNLWLILPAAVAAAGASYVQSHGIVTVRPVLMPYPTFVFAGAMAWQVFLEALNAPLRQLSANRGLVTRVRFPHEGLILAGVCDVLLNAMARLAALLVLCLAVRCPLAPSFLFIPLGIVALTVVGAGIGLLLAPLALLYDDIGRGLVLVTSLLVFLMPVAYPIRFEGWQRLNAILPLIDTTRGLLIGTAPAAGSGAALLFGIAVTLVAWPLYRLARPHVIARLG